MIEAPHDLPLSAYIRDPFVRAAFERAERDQGDASENFSLALDPKPQPLAGGAAAAPEQKELADA